MPQIFLEHDKFLTVVAIIPLRDEWLKDLHVRQDDGGESVATVSLSDEWLKEICCYSMKSISHNQEE